MQLAVLISAGLALALPSTAWSADPTKELFACLKAAREELAVAMDPPPGSPPAPPMPPVVVITCEGAAARDLFAALELLATQDFGLSGIPRRVAGDITCHRFPETATFTCGVSIGVTKQFVNAVR